MDILHSYSFDISLYHQIVLTHPSFPFLSLPPPFLIIVSSSGQLQDEQEAEVQDNFLQQRVRRAPSEFAALHRLIRVADAAVLHIPAGDHIVVLRSG